MSQKQKTDRRREGRKKRQLVTIQHKLLWSLTISSQLQQWMHSLSMTLKRMVNSSGVLSIFWPYDYKWEPERTALYMFMTMLESESCQHWVLLDQFTLILGKRSSHCGRSLADSYEFIHPNLTHRLSLRWTKNRFHIKTCTQTLKQAIHNHRKWKHTFLQMERQILVCPHNGILFNG